MAAMAITTMDTSDIMAITTTGGAAMGMGTAGMGMADR
jgi:hypothetical protein